MGFSYLRALFIATPNLFVLVVARRQVKTLQKSIELEAAASPSSWGGCLRPTRVYLNKLKLDMLEVDPETPRESFICEILLCSKVS